MTATTSTLSSGATPTPTPTLRSAFAPSRRNLGAWLLVAFLGEITAAIIGAAAGVTTWHNAFDNEGARLASPWPFLLGQIVLGGLALGTRRRLAATATGLLAGTFFVSVMSVGFDGSFGNGIPTGATVGQVVLLALFALVGGVAALRAASLFRASGHSVP